MSLLHSFYCWGHVAVVLLSTVFFTFAGIANWKILALIWAIIPFSQRCVFFSGSPADPDGRSRRSSLPQAGGYANLLDYAADDAVRRRQ